MAAIAIPKPNNKKSAAPPPRPRKAPPVGGQYPPAPSDTVDAKLTPGEFVIPAPAVKALVAKIGLEGLEDLRTGHMPGAGQHADAETPQDESAEGYCGGGMARGYADGGAAKKPPGAKYGRVMSKTDYSYPEYPDFEAGYAYGGLADGDWRGWNVARTGTGETVPGAASALGLRSPSVTNSTINQPGAPGRGFAAGDIAGTPAGEQLRSDLQSNFGLGGPRIDTSLANVSPLAPRHYDNQHMTGYADGGFADWIGRKTHGMLGTPKNVLDTKDRMRQLKEGAPLANATAIPAPQAQPQQTQPQEKPSGFVEPARNALQEHYRKMDDAAGYEEGGGVPGPEIAGRPMDYADYGFQGVPSNKQVAVSNAARNPPALINGEGPNVTGSERLGGYDRVIPAKPGIGETTRIPSSSILSSSREMTPRGNMPSTSGGGIGGPPPVSGYASGWPEIPLPGRVSAGQALGVALPFADFMTTSLGEAQRRGELRPWFKNMVGDTEFGPLTEMAGRGAGRGLYSWASQNDRAVNRMIEGHEPRTDYYATAVKPFIEDWKRGFSEKGPGTQEAMPQRPGTQDQPILPAATPRSSMIGFGPEAEAPTVTAYQKAVASRNAAPPVQIGDAYSANLGNGNMIRFHPGTAPGIPAPSMMENPWRNERGQPVGNMVGDEQLARGAQTVRDKLAHGEYNMTPDTPEQVAAAQVQSARNVALSNDIANGYRQMRGEAPIHGVQAIPQPNDVAGRVAMERFLRNPNEAMQGADRFALGVPKPSVQDMARMRLLNSGNPDDMQAVATNRRLAQPSAGQQTKYETEIVNDESGNQRMLAVNPKTGNYRIPEPEMSDGVRRFVNDIQDRISRGGIADRQQIMDYLRNPAINLNPDERAEFLNILPHLFPEFAKAEQ